MFRIKKISGFSMIEVLVSIIVISMGILGTSGLLIKGMGNAKTASLRGVAAMQATSLASTMYINRDFWSNRGIKIEFKSANGSMTSSSNMDFSKAIAGCGAVCTSAQMAGADVQAWIKSVNNTLPNSTATVTCLPAAVNLGHNCTIRINWDEKFFDPKNLTTSTSATSGTRSYFLHVEL